MIKGKWKHKPTENNLDRLRKLGQEEEILLRRGTALELNPKSSTTRNTRKVRVRKLALDFRDIE